MRVSLGSWRSRVALLVALVVWCGVREPAPLVRVRGGWLRGGLSADGQFYHYKGVPYATTTQHTRFQAPQSAPVWTGVLEATESTRCPQHMFLGVVAGETNCLTLDVAIPVARSTARLPVMVFVHGGCFFEGTGSDFLYGPDYLVRHQVIVIGLNYRLNIEGFLCLGTAQAPGNAGLKDQVAALRWIRENIAAFGGDPDNVTLFGESAGAVSASLLVLSPLARGLFHKVILQSGATLAPWALQHRPLATASALATLLGHNTSDPQELYQIFANKSPEELIRARMPTRRSDSITADLLFVPCVERNISGVEAIITEHPIDLLAAGHYMKVPMIIGFNDNEGIYFLSKDYGTSPKRVDAFEALQPDLVFANESEKKKLATRVERHYLSNLSSNGSLSRIIDLYSDIHFKYPSVAEAAFYARGNRSLFYYLFEYGGLLNMAKAVAGYAHMPGASHADELFYLFRPHSFPLPQRLLELDLIDKMTTMWTNFAKYSEPTPGWAPVRWPADAGVNPLALHIGRQLTIAPLYDPRPMIFWNHTYGTHRRRRYGFR